MNEGVCVLQARMVDGREEISSLNCIILQNCGIIILQSKCLLYLEKLTRAVPVSSTNSVMTIYRCFGFWEQDLIFLFAAALLKKAKRTSTKVMMIAPQSPSLFHLLQFGAICKFGN